MTVRRDPVPLRCNGVGKKFGRSWVVDHLDLTLDAGTVHALVGLNGSGKTTLMRLILAMARPCVGSVDVFGQRRAARVDWSGVGHMIETPFAYPDLTVRENLWAAAQLHGLNGRGVDRAIDRVVAGLELAEYLNRPARTLSAGNRQRVGLASALIHRPRLLILDEPTNALDPSGIVLLRELVVQAAESGTAVLVSSHHLDEVARVAAHISVLHGGRIVGDLDPGGVDLERSFFAMVHAADAAPRPATRVT